MREEMAIYKAHIRSTGGRSSKARDQIVEAFLEREGHVDAEGLYHELISSGKRPGRATVFRTMKMLANIGLARPLILADGVLYYEHSYNHEHHAHLICEECGKVMEFSGAEIEKLLSIAGRAEKFKVNRYRLTFLGICHDCGGEN